MESTGYLHRILATAIIYEEGGVEMAVCFLSVCRITLCYQSRRVIWFEKACLNLLLPVAAVEIPFQGFRTPLAHCCICCSTWYFLDLFQPFSSLVSCPLSLEERLLKFSNDLFLFRFVLLYLLTLS